MSSSGQQRIGFFPHADACAQLVTSEPPLEEAVDSADPDLAAELRAHGIAAESSGDIDKSVSCYAAEMSVRLRIFCDAIQAAPDTLSDETRNAGLEVCRSSESLARQSAAQGADEASIVHINQRALRCAEAALDPDHPVASGIRAHLGDSCMIFAKRCEAQRLGALREPDSSHYDQTETDEWRLKIVHLAHERDGFIAQAIGHYSDAVVRYRVVAALCLPEGSERDTTDPNGAFGTHVCHCLAKIAEAHYLSECASRAEDFQTRAEHEYNVYAERHAGVTKGESSAGTSCPLGWDFSMPYCSGFEYNAASLRTPVDLPDAIGHGCGILAVANQSGVSGDEAQAVLYGHRTWTPSVVEVCDALRETEKIAARLDSARGVAREFMASLRRNDGDWVVILMRHPLVAYVAAVDVESAVAAGGSPATLEELEQATVLVESPFSELIAERYSENLMYYGHLRLYSSLGDREIAKAHGNDWEGCAIPFKVPLLEALYGRNEKAVGVLLDMGHHPLACSPHDMCGALPAAIQAGDLAAAKVLLQHKVVTLHREEADAFELRCERVGVNIESVVSLAPLAESKQRVFGCKEDELTFSLLWELVMALPKSKAASWYAQYADMLLSKLNEEEGSATLLKTAFGASGLLHHLLPDALTRCIALDLVNISDTVLGMVTYNQQLELACKTSDLHLARVLFQTVSVNSIWRDTPVAQYHIDHGNLSILRFINDHPDFDDTLLSKEALAKFDTLVDSPGLVHTGSGWQPCRGTLYHRMTLQDHHHHQGLPHTQAFSPGCAVDAMTEPPQADGQAAPDAPAAGVPDVGDAAAAAAPVAAAPPAAEAGLAAAAASGGGADSEPAWIDGACVYAMYKPRGMITTNKPNPRATATHRRACMGQWLQEIIQGEDGLRVFHIGRLDKKTTGLLLATSVGHFGRFICTPGMLPKEYIVTTERLVTPEMVQMLVDGVQLHDGFAKALEAELMETRVERREVTQGQASRNVKRSRGERKRKAQEMEALAAAPEAQDMPEGGATAATPAVSVEKVTCVVRMVISMGRNHIVKRMFDHIGLSVTRLHRSAIGPCRLETFGLTEPGQHAKVPSEVLRTLWQHRTVGTEVIESDAEDEGEN